MKIEFYYSTGCLYVRDVSLTELKINLSKEWNLSTPAGINSLKPKNYTSG